MAKQRYDAEKNLWVDVEYAHNWMCFYIIQKYKGKLSKKYITRCKDIEWAQQRMNNIHHTYKLGRNHDNYNLDYFLMIVDGIEYNLSYDNKNSVKDALKVHEAFYEKEYGDGIKKEIDRKQRIKNESIILKGLSTSRKKRDNGEYIKYVCSVDLEKIAIQIAMQQTYSSCEIAREFNHMELHMPDSSVVALPDFTIDLDTIPTNIFSHSWYYNISEDTVRYAWVMGQVNDWIRPALEQSIAKAKEEREEAFLRIVGKNARPFKLTSFVLR